MTQHFVFTKFNMPHPSGLYLDPEWLEGRVELFKKYLLPSMKQQTCQDFKWIMHCCADSIGEAMDGLYEAEEEYENLEIIWLEKTRWHPEWLENIRDRVEPGLLLTSRIDSDDAVHKDFVKIIQTNPYLEPGFFYCPTHGYISRRPPGYKHGPPPATLPRRTGKPLRLEYSHVAAERPRRQSGQSVQAGQDGRAEFFQNLKRLYRSISYADQTR